MMIKFLSKIKISFLVYGLIIFLISLSLFWWWQLIFIVLSLLLGYWFFYGQPKNKIKFKNISITWLILPLMLILISHFLPFILYGQHPLGYDTGFYNYNINKERQFLSQNQTTPMIIKIDQSQLVKDHQVGWLSRLKNLSFDLTLIESLGSRWLTRGLIRLGWTNWMILYLFPILMSILLGWLIYILAKKHFNQSTAWWSILFYSLSLTQFLIYWHVFWKNILGLVIIFAILNLLSLKNKTGLGLALFLILFLLFSHRTSFFLIILVLIIYLIVSDYKFKYYLLVGLILLSLFFSWFNRGLIIYLWQQIASNFEAYYDFFAIRQGSFIEWSQYLIYSCFYLPLAVLGLIDLIKKKKINIIVIYTLILGALVLGKFIFYTRLIGFLDLGIIILAGYGFSNLLIKTDYFKKFEWLAGGVYFLIAVYFFTLVTAQQSLISQTELKNIQQMRNYYPQVKIFVPDSYYASWLYGFSDHEIIAPGLQDRWSLEKWQIFWLADINKQVEMLSQYKQFLLIYKSQTSFIDPTLDNQCFKKINEYFYLFICY
ncbi:MAG: hypothetical protein PHS07_02580 [Patescibacteria group bacterium]|nr:hypothetical protein [Patescibacteria group bacterium]